MLGPGPRALGSLGLADTPFSKELTCCFYPYLLQLYLCTTNVDGFVKSPSAALRFNPALLDKKLPFWDAGMKLLIFEGKSPFEKYLTG